MNPAHLLSALLALAIVSCEWTNPVSGGGSSRYLAAYGPAQQEQRAETDPGAALPDDVSYWAGDGKTGAPLIKINRRQQKAFFYKGSELVGVSRISTGKEGHDTPPGRYKVTEKSKNHRSNLYGVFKEKGTGRVVNDDVDTRKDKVPPGCYYEGAPMWNFLRFNGGVGMHTGYLPGYNASHGCVRMPDKMAKKFFKNTKVGTPVIVE
ncbi:MAG: L,D-transpeptidase family protein [Verrucomicrobiota bacterium]